MKRAVIDAAFHELFFALVPFTEATAPPRTDLPAHVLAHLRRDHDVAPLVLQVIAQLGVAGIGDADAVARAVADARAAATVQLAGLLRHVTREAGAGSCRSEAERLMRWYVAACTLVATSASDAELVAMARGA